MQQRSSLQGMVAPFFPLMLAALFALDPMPSLAGGTRSSVSSLPEDVRDFISRRDECDHFRSEDSPDAERRAEIDRELKRLCTGTDAELARLLRNYAKNKDVRHALEDYDPDIEF